MSSYFKVLLLALMIPFLLSFYPPLRFYRNLRGLIISIGIPASIFILWDILATWRGHWWFEPSGISGVHIANLPVEEVLFFVVIPFCCLFTWEVFQYFGRDH